MDIVIEVDLHVTGTLTVTIPTNYELREDGSIELREDGTKELRE